MPQGDPLVSIRCLVYNHEPYLRQCLDGFVMQKTNFPFEAIVHDDASTDGSAAIIREYAEKYPHIIKPIYETENQYGKGIISKNMDAVMHPNSKYIALCEGDDYWTDPHKLQIQVEFLESHPDYVMCSHDYRVFDQERQELRNHSYCDWLLGDKKNEIETYEFSLANYFDGWWTQPLTCVFRKGAYGEEMKKKGYKSSRDVMFFYNVLTHGKGMLFVSVMGVYRIHSGGIWSKKDNLYKAQNSRESALQIFQIENDKNAFKVIEKRTIDILEYEKYELASVKRELTAYYKVAPFDKFLKLLWMIFRDLMSKS